MTPDGRRHFVKSRGTRDGSANYPDPDWARCVLVGRMLHHSASKRGDGRAEERSGEESLTFHCRSCRFQGHAGGGGGGGELLAPAGNYNQCGTGGHRHLPPPSRSVVPALCRRRHRQPLEPVPDRRAVVTQGYLTATAAWRGQSRCADCSQAVEGSAALRSINDDFFHDPVNHKPFIKILI